MAWCHRFVNPWCKASRPAPYRDGTAGPRSRTPPAKYAPGPYRRPKPPRTSFPGLLPIWCSTGRGPAPQKSAHPSPPSYRSSPSTPVWPPSAGIGSSSQSTPARKCWSQRVAKMSLVRSSRAAGVPCRSVVSSRGRSRRPPPSRPVLRYSAIGREIPCNQ